MASTRIRLAVAAAIAVATTVVVVAFRHHGYPIAVIWSALIVTSFVGWGSLVNLWLSRDCWMDWGLRAGWGMALSLLQGGFLCAMHVAIRPVLIAQVSLGVAALLGTSVIRGWPAWSGRRMATMVGKSGVLALVMGAYSLAVYTFFAYLGNQQFQPSDDPPLYFVFAERLLQTGSLLEPFAGRRITTFGGQPYLHASFLSVAPICYLHVVDAGISLVLVVALLVGHLGRGRLRAWHGAPLGLAFLLLFSLTDVRVNTGSLMSGVAAILTLYRTVRAPFRLEADRPAWPMDGRRAVALAALAVVCIVLRTSNAAAVLPFIVLVTASDFILGSRRPWTRQALGSLGRVVSLSGAGFVAAIAPWSVMQYQSCGTWFFPLGHDNLTPGWQLLQPAQSPGEVASNLVGRIFYDAPISLFVPFVVLGLVQLAGRARNDLVALTIGSLVGIVSLARNATLFDPHDTSRYYYAYVVATALVGSVTTSRAASRAALAAVAVAMHLATTRDTVQKRFHDLVGDARRGFERRELEAIEFAARAGDYLDVQSHVPPGATVVTAVHEGWQFDFARNQLFALDVLGGMGPKPGWPVYRGAQALGDYLAANGVRYLIWVDFSLPSEFYNRSHWQSYLSSVGSYLQAEARIQLDAEDAIEKLSAMHRALYRAHGMTVVDLLEPPSVSN